DDPDFRKHFSSVVRRDVRRLVEVFEQLAAVVTEGALNFTTVDVHTIVDDVVSTIEGADDGLGKRLQLEVTRDPAPLSVKVDVPQLRKALSYLVWYLTHNSPAEHARVSVSGGRHTEKGVSDNVQIFIGSRMLLKPAYHIQTAENGRAALEAVEWFRPDVVLMDIKMPEIDGLELLRRVKNVDPTIEVIMITAYASLETVKHALTHGAFEYLIKPFARQDLEDVVRRALLRRHTELGARSEVTRLVEEMRQLATKTRQLEETARREAAEQSLRVTQLSILREISRT